MRKWFWVILGLFIGALVAGGCSPGGKEGVQIESCPVIGHLQTADKTVTIYSGPEQPMYNVLSSKGQILADNLTVDQVVARFPDLAELVQRGYAELDARYYPSRDD